MTRDAVLDRVEPAAIGSAGFEQPCPLAQMMLAGRDPAGMLGIEGIDQPVEEAPACLGATHEQAIHLRRDPDQA